MSITRKFAAAVVLIAFAGQASLVTAQARLERADASMLKDVAQANMAEVEAGKLAVEKSDNVEVKKFAQMMVDDHSKGVSDTRTLASKKGVELPDGSDARHKAVMVEFKALRGDTFDSRYVKQAGVGDHEATEKLLKKVRADARDPELKELAAKMLPVVQGHLQHARQLATSVGK
jgi:putative membrane protein